MPYKQPWGIHQPGCVIILIDRSCHTSAALESTGAGEETLCDAIARQVNSFIGELGRRCVKGDQMSPRFHVSLLSLRIN